MTDFTATTSPAIFETNGSTNTWRVSNVGVEGPAGETFPTQTGNGGAVLGTNGTATSWARSFTSPDGETVISTYDGGGGLDWDGAGGAYAYADVDSVEGAFITAGDGVSESATVKAKSDGTIALVSTGAATLNSHALVVDTDARLTDARTPTAHKSSHATGGGDALSPSDIGAVATAATGPMTAGRSSGIEVLDRRHVTTDTTLSTGVLGLMYFTPLRDVSVTTVAFCTSGQAAGATPTRIRAAIYSTSGTDITAELANTANDTSLFASTYTAYTKALSATVNLVAGTQYALGLLVVSGATMPKLAGCGIIVGALTPFVAGQIGGLTDLPSSFPRTPSALGQTWWGRLS